MDGKNGTICDVSRGMLFENSLKPFLFEVLGIDVVMETDLPGLKDEMAVTGSNNHCAHRESGSKPNPEGSKDAYFTSIIIG